MYFFILDAAPYDTSGTMISDLSATTLKIATEQILNSVSGNPIIYQMDAHNSIVASSTQVYIPVEYTTSPLAGTWVPVKIYNMVLYHSQDFYNYFRTFMNY